MNQNSHNLHSKPTDFNTITPRNTHFNPSVHIYDQNNLKFSLGSDHQSINHLSAPLHPIPLNIQKSPDFFPNEFECLENIAFQVQNNYKPSEQPFHQSSYPTSYSFQNTFQHTSSIYPDNRNQFQMANKPHSYSLDQQHEWPHSHNLVNLEKIIADNPLMWQQNIHSSENTIHLQQEQSSTEKEREKPSQVLLVMIFELREIDISNDLIHSLFLKFGFVNKVLIFKKSSEQTQAFVEMDSIESALKAKLTLNRAKIPLIPGVSKSFKLKVHFSQTSELNLCNYKTEGKDYRSLSVEIPQKSIPSSSKKEFLQEPDYQRRNFRQNDIQQQNRCTQSNSLANNDTNQTESCSHFNFPNYNYAIQNSASSFHHEQTNISPTQVKSLQKHHQKSIPNYLSRTSISIPTLSENEGGYTFEHAHVHSYPQISFQKVPNNQEGIDTILRVNAQLLKHSDFYEIKDNHEEPDIMNVPTTMTVSLRVPFAMDDSLDPSIGTCQSFESLIRLNQLQSCSNLQKSGASLGNQNLSVDKLPSFSINVNAPLTNSDQSLNGKKPSKQISSTSILQYQGQSTQENIQEKVKSTCSTLASSKSSNMVASNQDCLHLSSAFDTLSLLSQSSHKLQKDTETCDTHDTLGQSQHSVTELDSPVIYLKNVNFCNELQPENMYNIFRNFGYVHSVLFMREKKTILIEFDEPNQAKMAINQLNNVLFLRDEQMRISFAKRKTISPSQRSSDYFANKNNDPRSRVVNQKKMNQFYNPASRTLYVTNIPIQLVQTKQDLLKLFAVFGTITNSRINIQEMRVSAFIELDSLSSALKSDLSSLIFWTIILFPFLIKTILLSTFTQALPRFSRIFLDILPNKNILPKRLHYKKTPKFSQNSFTPLYLIYYTSYLNPPLLGSSINIFFTFYYQLEREISGYRHKKGGKPFIVIQQI